MRFLLLVALVLCCPTLLLAATADDAAVRRLIDTAADPGLDAEARTQTFGELTSLGTAAVPPLIGLLKDAKPNVRAVSAYALGQIAIDQRDDRVVDPLLDVFARDAELVVRMNAALALGGTGSPKAVAPLLGALDDRDIQMRRIAAASIVRLNRRETVQPLAGRVAKETDPEIARNLIRVLGSLAAVAQLEELRRSVADPELSAEIEQQIGVAKTRAETEGEPAQARAVPRAQSLYFFFASAKDSLSTLALILLVLPAAILTLWTLVLTPLRAWPLRLGLVLLGAMLAIVCAGIASLPGFAAGIGHPDPGSAVIILLPFLAAASTLPVVVCGCLVRVRIRGGFGDALSNAAIWAAVYALLQFGTWHFIPLVLRGNYFYYGRHPGWYATQIGYVIGVALTCGAITTLAGRIPETSRLDALAPRPFLAMLIPCAVVLGTGYLLINIYSY